MILIEILTIVVDMVLVMVLKNMFIKEQVTLINISLGVTENSIELADACKEALMNNIIIVSAASHRNTVSFPADYRTVLSVNVDQNQSEKIKLVDDNSVNLPTITVTFSTYKSAEE